jgi:hypothetical protein
LVVLGVGLAVSAIAFVGIRSFFNRPGESALTIVPSDALGVVVCDFQPGPEQLGAFRKLFSASDGADMQKSFDSVSQMMGDSAWLKEAIPHLRHSGIFALIPGSRPSGGSTMDQTDPIFILPVSDPGGLENLLRKHLVFDAAHDSYSMKGQEFKAAMLGNDLVVGRSDRDLDAVRVCRSDTSRSFASLDQYSIARKSIDADANLMLFITDSGFRTFGKAVGDRRGFPVGGWFAAGLAVRDEGLAVSCTVPISANDWAPYKELAAMPPVRRDLFDHLPSGAYGVSAVSQPAAIWKCVADQMKDPDARKKLVDFEAKVNREIGVNLEDPNGSALSGTSVAATYPEAATSLQGYDTLLLMDDSNGARPSDSVDRLVSYIEKNLADTEYRGPLFNPAEIAGVPAFTLSGEIQKKWENSNLSSASRDQRRLLDGKTIAYAIVGHAVLVASSVDLLGRGIRAYQGQGSVLSSDTHFASFSPIAGDSPQFFSEVDVSRVAAAAGSAVPWDSVPQAGKAPVLGAIKALGAFRRPGTMSIHLGETSVFIHMFIPMDYDSIGQFVKDQAKTPGPGASRA